MRRQEELRGENALGPSKPWWWCSVSYVCASDVYVRALLEDSFWSG